MQLFAELLEASDWKDFKNKNDVAMFSKPSEGKLDFYMRKMTVATDVSLAQIVNANFCTEIQHRQVHR